MFSEKPQVASAQLTLLITVDQPLVVSYLVASPAMKQFM